MPARSAASIPGDLIMMRQYHAQRARGGPNPLRVGIISIGSIYYIQDRGIWHDRFGPAPIRRNPWIVEAFLNGICAASRYDAESRQWQDVYISRRSDLAVVRSLRDGRRTTVAVHILAAHDDLGLAREPTDYPTLPDLALYRVRCPCSGAGGGRGKRHSIHREYSDAPSPSLRHAKSPSTATSWSSSCSSPPARTPAARGRTPPKSHCPP
jgi:hypothetical protein